MYSGFIKDKKIDRFISIVIGSQQSIDLSCIIHGALHHSPDAAILISLLSSQINVINKKQPYQLLGRPCVLD